MNIEIITVNEDVVGLDVNPKNSNRSENGLPNS